MIKKYGQHLICEATLCDSLVLNNEVELVNIMLKACIDGGAGILGHITHKFDPQGVTVVVGLSESHTTIHSWPEDGVATIDCYTCGDRVDTKLILNEILTGIKSEKFYVQKFDRGIPKEGNSSYSTTLEGI